MRLQLKMGVIGREGYDKTLSFLLFLYCMALPFEEALALSFGSILRLLGLVIIAYCFASYFRSKIKVRDIRLLFPFLLWIILAVVSVLWSSDLSWWYYFTKIYIVQLTFALTVVAYQRFIDLQYLKNGIVCGALIAALMLIFMPSLTISTEERRTIVMFGKIFDPNLVASIIMLAMFLLIDELFYMATKKKRVVIAMLILAAGMLYTGSRGALISFVAGLGFYLLLQMKRRGTRKRVRFFVVLATCTGIAVLLAMPEELRRSRFSAETILGLNEYESGAHNRWTIWGHALSLVGGAPIFGYGCGNFFSAIATVYRECAAHNLYLLLLIEEGFVGLLVFVYGLYRIIKKSYYKKLYSAVAMLCAVCVMALTLDTITYKYFWISIILSVMEICKAKDEKLNG